MPPAKPLPCSDEFASPEEYVEELLDFVTTNKTFKTLCGAVHVVDFFITEPGLFYDALPAEWHDFLLSQDVMRLLDFFLRDDPRSASFDNGKTPPTSLVHYIGMIRKLSLRRELVRAQGRDDKTLPPLTRTVAVGMNPKKMHEVRNFADYVSRLSSDLANGDDAAETTHFVDLGSGQNYLGRALASEPYNRRVVAVEGRQRNVDAAKSFDVTSGLAAKPKILRNKKIWNQILAVAGPDKNDPEALAAAIRQVAGDEGNNFRKIGGGEMTYTEKKGKGLLQYVSGRLEDGHLADIISSIDDLSVSGETTTERPDRKRLKLMAVSIHSCGNLSHFGIRSLLLNDDIHAVAIVGCCYNLVTEKPDTAEQRGHDAQGFPMSEKLSTYRGQGVRANATARMMACQAPQNWTSADSEVFYTRHFYRAMLQKVFLDRGAVHKIPSGGDDGGGGGGGVTSTSPLAIGTLGKRSYAGGFGTYVRAAVEKLRTSPDFTKFAAVMGATMADVSEEELDGYLRRFGPRKRELCVVWSLMACSAMLVEAVMVTDRWLWLKEQTGVAEAWVEAVFEYGKSPRNLVVVGVKKKS